MARQHSTENDILQNRSNYQDDILYVGVAILFRRSTGVQNLMHFQRCKWKPLVSLTGCSPTARSRSAFILSFDAGTGRKGIIDHHQWTVFDLRLMLGCYHQQYFSHVSLLPIRTNPPCQSGKTVALAIRSVGYTRQMIQLRVALS